VIQHAKVAQHQQIFALVAIQVKIDNSLQIPAIVLEAMMEIPLHIIYILYAFMLLAINYAFNVTLVFLVIATPVLIFNIEDLAVSIASVKMDIMMMAVIFVQVEVSNIIIRLLSHLLKMFKFNHLLRLLY
jgi:hypothetical protein